MKAEKTENNAPVGKTVLEDLKGLWRMRLKFWRGGGRLQEVPDSKGVQLPQRPEIANNRGRRELDHVA